jgi:hypothetical protein
MEPPRPQVARTSHASERAHSRPLTSGIPAAGAHFAANGFPRDAYDAWIASVFPVGSPKQAIDAIMRPVELLGIDRFMRRIDVGNLRWAMTRESP